MGSQRTEIIGRLPKKLLIPPCAGQYERLAHQYPDICVFKVHRKSTNFEPSDSHVYWDFVNGSQYFKRNENLFKFIPASNYLFSVAGGDKKYKPTKVDNPYGDYSDEKYRVYLPSVLSERAAFKDFSKYYKAHLQPPLELRLAYDLLVEFTNTFLHSYKETPLHEVLTEHDFSTSVGKFWSSVKSGTGKQITKRELMNKPEFWDYFWEYRDLLGTDDANLSVFNVSLKEELRHFEKVAEEKTRTICAAPIEHTLCCGIEFQDLHNQFMQAGLATRCLYGFTPYYGGWDILMRKFSGFNYCNGRDATQFDSSMRQFVFEYFTDWLLKYLPSDASEERKMRVRNLVSQVCFAVCHLPTGDVVFKDFGNATGWYLTFLINCWMNMLMSCYQHVKSTHHYTLESWLNSGVEFFCGDDHKMARKEDYDMQYYCDIVKEIGITCTPDLLSPVRPEDHEFVSRHTVKDGNMYVSYGNPEKMQAAMASCFSSTHPADVIIKLCAIRRDMFYHKSIYNECSSTIEYLFALCRGNSLLRDDPLLEMARSSYEPDFMVRFLHTGKL